MSLSYEDLIKDLGIISDLVYDHDYIENAKKKEILKTNMSSLTPDFYKTISYEYKVEATSKNDDSGFQWMLLKSKTTDEIGGQRNRAK